MKKLLLLSIIGVGVVCAVILATSPPEQDPIEVPFGGTIEDVHMYEMQHPY